MPRDSPSLPPPLLAQARTLDAGQREVLGRLKEHIRLFGVANDADDHKRGAELRRRGAEAIRALLEEHALVAELLPTLCSELATRHIEGFGWAISSTSSAAFSSPLARTGRDPGAAGEQVGDRPLRLPIPVGTSMTPLRRDVPSNGAQVLAKLEWEESNESGHARTEEHRRVQRGFSARRPRILEEVRKTIREAAPGAGEAIRYRMPTFTLNGNMVHFAAYARHVGFYPTPSAIERFGKELSAWKGAKVSVQFPLDEPLPLALIGRIVRFRVKEQLDLAKGRRRGKPTASMR